MTLPDRNPSRWIILNTILLFWIAVAVTVVAWVALVTGPTP